MEKRVPILALTLALLPGVGCETFSSQTCDRSVTANPPVVYQGGAAADGVYLSAPWDGELLWFPGGMIYALDHGLPAPPRWVSMWISLDRDGLANGGTLARASPNEAVILDVDASTVEVQNDGCQDFWLLVAAGTGATQPAPP